MNKSNALTFILILAVFQAFPAAAADKWHNHKNEGWFFYNDPPPRVPETPAEEKKEEPKNNQSSKSEPSKPAHIVIKETGELMLGNAMVNPTEANVKAYMEYQKMMTDGANTFANVWERVLAKNPELYLAAYSADEVKDDMQSEIKKLAAKTGIFFFYSSTCQYCRKQVSSIIDLQRKYGFNIMAISTDGEVIPELARFTITDNGISQNLGIQAVPAIYLAYPEQDIFQPISQGYLDYNDIERRLYHYAQMEKGTK